MPMSPRLLRPRASSALVATDADAKAYINAVRLADGGQYMEAGVQRAIDSFVIGCKADGTWSAIKASCILMGARTLSGALTPLVGAAPTNNNFVSGDYNRKTGLKGNGSTKTISTNRASNADPQDNFHLSAFRTEVATANGSLIGSNATTTGHSHLYLQGNVSVFYRSRTGAADAQGISTLPAVAFFGSSRSAAASYSTSRHTTDATVVTASDGLATSTFTLFATAGVTDARIAFYSIGESLSLALLRTRITALYNAIGAAIL